MRDYEGRLVLYTADGGRQIGDDEMTLYHEALAAAFDRSEMFIARAEPPLEPEAVCPY